MIKEYSLKKDGNNNISANFRVKEFACKDNSDLIQIDTNLVSILQKFRDSIGKPVIIASGYRTKEYNYGVDGKENSYHLKGMAAQIKVDGMKCEDIAHWFYKNGAKGIGIIYENEKESVHIDTRDGDRYCFKQINNEIIKVDKF